MKKTLLYSLFVLFCVTAKAQNAPVFNGKSLVEVSTIPNWSFAARPAGWYRVGTIPSASTLRGNATFELREDADHSTLRFEVGISYNGVGGSSFTLTSHSYFSAVTFKKIRLITSGAYDASYLEVYVEPHNNNNLAFYAYLFNPVGNGDWTLVNWTPGTIPTGYTVKEFNVDKIFAVGTMVKGNIFSVGRNGDVAVNGNLHANEIKVEADAWPDYVFSDQYKLLTLPETEQFIKTNNRLPNIPSAKTIAQEGLSLGEMNKLLMEKIEELTLHLIEKDKQDREMKKQVNLLKAQFNSYKAKH